MKAIEANWYNLLHGATVGMFGYIVSNSLNVALVTFCGATLLSCVIFTKELTKEDRSNLKIGIAISFIIMAGVTIGQLIIPDSAVKGEPIHSALFTIGFLLFFTAICISERINTDLMHAIYNWIGHIRAYHIKGSHWYDLLFGVIVGGSSIRNIKFSTVHTYRFWNRHFNILCNGIYHRSRLFW